jgi:hypothetical protein
VEAELRERINALEREVAALREGLEKEKKEQAKEKESASTRAGLKMWCE